MFSIPRKSFGGRLQFLVGRDAEGHWLAIETHGRGGGIFADRSAALRYAVFETGHRARAVRMTAKTLSLL
uniref:Uncharacterized protein n=1 Tax=Bosea sp. NBC_00436 TaxID=2969620 RepID=A0A9E7ZJX1_9HYPH